MSFERYFHWICEDCGKEELTLSGFPKGWVWLSPINGRKTVEHRCLECKEKVPKHEIGCLPQHGRKT